MNPVNPAHVTEGLVGIRRNDIGDLRMPARSNALVSGGPVEKYIDAIFRGENASDTALGLVDPIVQNPKIESYRERAVMLKEISSRLKARAELNPDDKDGVAQKAERVLDQVHAAWTQFDTNNRALYSSNPS
mgnify:CR=1 FL=1